MDIIELAKYGISGVAIAAIILAGYFGRLLFKLVSNHLRHNTEEQIKNIAATNRLTEVIIELKNYLCKSNGKR